MNAYCVKCKRKTNSSQTQIVKTKNNKYISKGICRSCGCKTSTFVGSGLLGKALNLKDGKIPILGDIPLIGPLLF